MIFLRLSCSLALAATLAPLASLVSGCGYGRSEALEDDGGVAPPHPTPRNDDGGSCGALPNETSCVDPCGAPVGVTCVDGSWQCPEYGDGVEVDCPAEDAGADACSSAPPFACSQPEGCTGAWAEAVCSGGAWTCQLNGACEEDAWVSPPDAAPPPPPDYYCGGIPCDPSTHYCEITAGGPVLEDGGSPTSFACLALPGCDAPATCACVVSSGIVPGTCGCTGGAGGGEPLVIVTCAVP